MGEEIGSVCINGMTTDFLFFGCVSSRLGGRIFLSILIVNIAAIDVTLYCFGHELI